LTHETAGRGENEWIKAAVGSCSNLRLPIADRGKDGASIRRRKLADDPKGKMLASTLPLDTMNGLEVLGRASTKKVQSR
jgi:hypothetical protein